MKYDAQHRCERATAGDKAYGPTCPECGGNKDRQSIRCRACHAKRTHGEQYTSRRTCACGSPKDRTSARCIACDLEHRREQRKQDPANIANRARIPRKVDTAKTRARNAAQARVRRGKVQRQPCEVCGAVEVEMHHEDYDKPLEVRWLCRKHHRELHRKAA
jgi:hypothetical protein